MVNSAKNIFYKNIVLVPEDGNTDNFVTLSDCGLIEGENSRHAQCFGIINVPSKYTVNIEYISQNDTEGNPLTITINDSPSFINEVYNITPNEIELTTEPIVFILTVNFVTNLDHYLFSLIEIDSEKIINLKDCSQVENWKTARARNITRWKCSLILPAICTWVTSATIQSAMWLPAIE